MKNKIRIFFCLLCAILCLNNTLAQYTITIDDVEFDSATGTIKSYKWPDEGKSSIVIPETLNGIAVEILGVACFLNPYTSVDPLSGLATVEIPNSVKRIENNAFNFNKISKLSLGNSITFIGEYAFTNNGIVNLVLPNSLETIEPNAFYGNKIESLTFPQSLKKIQRGAFGYNNLTILNLPLSLDTIETDAFVGNNISELNLPESVSYLSGFRENNFTHITIPSHVKEVGTAAFAQNPLSSVTITEGVESIGESAFWTGISIPSATLKSTVVDLQGTLIIPSSVKYIGINTFRGNANLNEVIFNEGLISIGSGAFQFCGITDVQIPSTLKSIGDGAFSVNKIKTLSLPEGIEEIKSSAFSNNEILSVTIPGTVKNIGNKAFYDNSTMNEIVINDGVEKIGTECFSYNQSIHTISLPTSLLEIEEGAFLNSFFSTITLPAVVKEDEIFSHWATYSGNNSNTIDVVKDLSGNSELGYVAVFANVSTGLESISTNRCVYSNPVYHTFQINQSGSMEIFNLVGNKILSQQIEKDHPIDLSNFPSGVYIFVLNKNIKGKFIKKD